MVQRTVPIVPTVPATRRAAMLAFYVAAFRGVRPPTYPQTIRALPLCEAAETLRSLGNLAECERALALFAGGKLQYRSDHLTALRILCEGINKLSPGSRKPRDELVANITSMDSRLSRREAELEVYRLVDRGQDAQEVEQPTTEVQFDPRSLITSISIKIKVRQPSAQTDLESIACLVNPLKWSEIYKDNFKKTYLCTEDFKDTGDAVTVADNLVPGYAYHGWGPDNGMFFEQLEVNDVSGDGRFVARLRNVLNVTFSGLLAAASRSDDVSSYMTFSLHRSSTTDLVGQQFPAGLDVDNGFSAVYRTDDGWIWQTLKNLRFLDLTPGTGPAFGPVDFGELSNYFAPGIVSLAFESGMVAAVNDIVGGTQAANFKVLAPYRETEVLAGPGG